MRSVARFRLPDQPCESRDRRPAGLPRRPLAKPHFPSREPAGHEAGAREVGALGDPVQQLRARRKPLS
jgi:hypothetical protein